MRKSLRVLVPLAAAAAPFALMAGPGHRADGGSSYQTTLNPLNDSSGFRDGDRQPERQHRPVSLSWTGLAAEFGGGAYPHVQHIHIAGGGACPTPDADKNDDGVISTTEGGPAYGGIGTTLSVKGDTSPKAGTDIKIAPSGGSATTPHHQGQQRHRAARSSTARASSWCTASTRPR